MMKKIFFLCAAVFFCTASFAEKWNVYAGADQETVDLIKKCDGQIENREYQSASYTVGGCQNEYVIYKYIEVCTQYFAMSLMHSMFAFKNLEENETLHDVRTKEGNMNLIYREEPDSIIDNYIKEHGNSIVLELARANYYYDALMRYENQWLKTPDEILTLTKDVYSRAIKEEVYDERVVSNYASILHKERNWPEAEKLYILLTDRFSTNGSYWYNLTAVRMYQGKYGESIEAAKKAIENPEADREYQMDAYLVLSDAYAWSGDYDSAEKNLLVTQKKFPDQPIVFQRLGELYVCFRDNLDYEKADEYFDKVLSVVCDDTTIFNCVKEYAVNCTPQMGIEFCRRNMKVHKEEINQGRFNFFLAQFYVQTADKVNAEESLKNAEDIFNKIKDNNWIQICSQFRTEMENIK